MTQQTEMITVSRSTIEQLLAVVNLCQEKRMEADELDYAWSNECLQTIEANMGKRLANSFAKRSWEIVDLGNKADYCVETIELALSCILEMADKIDGYGLELDAEAMSVAEFSNGKSIVPDLLDLMQV